MTALPSMNMSGWLDEQLTQGVLGQSSSPMSSFHSEGLASMKSAMS